MIIAGAIKLLPSGRPPVDAFGIRFNVNDQARFHSLRTLFFEVKHDKQRGRFRDPADWIALVPDDLKGKFSWPTPEEPQRWMAVRDSTVIWVPEPGQQIGARWDFYRLFEAIEEGDYELLECGVVNPGVAEMSIDPHGYPYGGVGPLIALAEAFGFDVIGVNESGRYMTRNELLGGGASRSC